MMASCCIAADVVEGLCGQGKQHRMATHGVLAPLRGGVSQSMVMLLAPRAALLEYCIACHAMACV